ncbi:helix-turn-helix protein [Diaminobutyricimonas aerilata]|uniref:Helix-turn-helix protein n=1 Tax=Diaminobutyricimonas aerilata TaxID=1162967 RepID=A0A2M9CLP1_9MICO|nr:XRE family transcriptional regulator [Diaminobutyricimonas aerilata]PJJ72799.1 helix-turn-helix protein [Diaminobutyricimonas aerilata]
MELPARLRERRRRAGLTLAVAAERAGLSVSTLSRMETGERRVPLETAIDLARAYGVSLDELVADPTVSTPEVQRHGTRTYTALGPTLRTHRAHRITIEASDVHPTPRVHAGREWLYVLSGRMRLVLGDEDITVAAGETAEFDTRLPHWFGSDGSGRVDLLSLFDTEGERIHLRVQTSPKREG